MIRTFANRATRDVFEQRDTKAARRALPHEIWPRAQARQYRICFGFRDADAWDVEITDYH